MNPLLLDEIIQRALHEDLGFGDRTTLAIVPEGDESRGSVLAKQHGVVAGLPVFKRVMHLLDPTVQITQVVEEGESVQPGTVVLRIEGPTRSILSGERVALNFLQRLSGIASITRQAVDKVKGYPTKITDTRKTTPGLRMLEKYAVTVGGGVNHRLRLDDAVLIKDNHIQAAGSLQAAVNKVKERMGHTVFIEVEAETMAQVQEAIQAGVNGILLDNMSLDQLREAVNMIPSHIVTEASGGVRLEQLEAVAETGVQLISLGWLTHSAPALDFSLNLEGSVKNRRTEQLTQLEESRLPLSRNA